MHQSGAGAASLDNLMLCKNLANDMQRISSQAPLCHAGPKLAIKTGGGSAQRCAAKHRSRMYSASCSPA